MRRVGLSLAVLTLCALPPNLISAQRPGAPQAERRQSQPLNPLLRLFDADRDGVLSEAEIAASSARLKELDTSQDGRLADNELRRAIPFRPRPGGRGPAPGPSSSDFEKDPLAKDDAEERILSTLREMWRGERFRNVSPTDGRLLRLLVETTGAKRVVEIGTSTGESAVWMALGLKSTAGRLFTHEIDAGRAEIARGNFKKAGVDGIVTLIEGDAHQTVEQHREPIDILFLDADKEGYLDYLNKLLPLLRPGGLIVAHNMNTRHADPRYVKAVTENPKLETLILLKEGTGVGVTLKKR